MRSTTRPARCPPPPSPPPTPQVTNPALESAIAGLPTADATAALVRVGGSEGT
ncbi:hypothetical protein [Streptomyces capitiformicae]|uniref:hypothetical protein n=1 Tax=Streptomyces capitiformicae TaxID=2014920 RepID=UPI001E2CCF35|nr:hypothetical protein [Streptomyces capitiformicae]